MDMEYKKFSYPGYQLLNGFTFLCLILIFLGYGVAAVYYSITHPLSLQDALGILLGILVLSFATFLDILIWFRFPDLRMDPQGVELRAGFWRRRVPWTDIRAARRVGRVFYEEYVVSVRHLSPLHYLYGLISFYRWEPCFLISSYLPGYPDAIAEIRRHIHQGR